jgi:uncharacterized protein (DUF427 family)
MRAIVHGETIAESTDVVECDGYYYFPRSSVRMERLERAGKTASDLRCPHGVQFYDVLLAGKRFERVAWSYEAPRESMQRVAERVSFWEDVEVVAD